MLVNRHIAQRLTVIFSVGLAGLTTFASATAATPARPPAEIAAPSPCSADCFVLTGLTIDGVTAYPMKELAPLYADELAREVGMADLVAIAQRITDKYRADGYFLTRAVVPRQADASGHARIRVYEGYVSEVAYDGDRAAATAVKQLMGPVAGAKPLRLSEVDRRLALASDLPGVKVHTRLEPVLEDPAEHKLVVESQTRRFNGSLYVDNRGSRSSGPWQAYGRGAMNSAIRSGDQLSLGVLTTPVDPKEFTQGEIAYSAPLRGGGQIRTSVSASKAQTGSRAVNEFGNESRAFGLRLSVPIERRRDRSLWVAGGVDARRVEQDWTGGEAVDELRVARIASHGDITWRGGYSTGFIQVSRGLDILGATDTVSNRRSRRDADGQFWKVNAQASHYRDIGKRAGIYVSAEGQWADRPLLGSEEFSAGALPYGRGYNYGEIMGERGIAGQVELRTGWDPKLRPLTFFQAYTFLDGAKAWNENAAPGRRSAALSSAGVGLRLRFGDRMTVRIEAVKPLTRTPYDEGDKDWRPFVSISSAF